MIQNLKPATGLKFVENDLICPICGARVSPENLYIGSYTPVTGYVHCQKVYYPAKTPLGFSWAEGDA